MPNPNIAKAGQSSRFQKGNTAAKDRTTRSSYRNYLRRILAMPGDFEKEIVPMLMAEKPTMFEQLAITRVRLALSGNLRAQNRLERIIDGAPLTADEIAWGGIRRRNRKKKGSTPAKKEQTYGEAFEEMDMKASNKPDQGK